MRKLSVIFIYSGVFLTLASLIFFLAIFYPVILLELKYRFLGPDSGVRVELRQDAKEGEEIIIPVDEEFGIVVPKIRANSKIIPNVNPYNANEYQIALTRGVAHAKNTGFPGQNKNIFLFSHSSVNFYEATAYNSIFYLLNKMEKDDEIYLFYKGEKFRYSVVDKKIIDAGDISYLENSGTKERLILMTCWPPGTTLKRLLVIASLD